MKGLFALPCALILGAGPASAAMITTSTIEGKAGGSVLVDLPMFGEPGAY